ncbi:MAG TPA: hypothetical protein VF615_23865 [Longimicrobiaceae bacterium]
MLGVFGLQGCDGIIGYVTATYTGPKPASEPLRGEIVTIRTLYTRSDGRIYTLHADRMRFVDAKDPHNINRIVDVKPGDAEAALKALQPKVGDRLRISTQFQGIGEASGLEDKVPDWPYGRYIDYPIGVHLLTSVERAAP